MKKVLALLFPLAALSGVANGGVFLETGFEGSSSLPAGWTQSQIAGSATWNIQEGGKTGGSNPSSAHGGTNNATLYVANKNDNRTQLISPTFNSDGYTNITLSFWHTQEFRSPDQDELKVLYSSDGGSTWDQLAHYTDNVSIWTQHTLNLPTGSSNSRLAFEGNAKYGYGVCLDDIQVTGIPESFSEFSVSATDGTASEAGQEQGAWTITRIGNTAGALSVNYTLSGTATAGSDYNVSIPSPITFAAGQTSRVVTLTPVDDTVGGEGVEVATLTLTSGTGYVIGEASDDITIDDDEGYDLNILVIGSTHSFSEGGEHDVVHEKPFNPTTIATHLQGILARDPLLNDTVNVVFEDVFKTKTNTVRTSSTGIDDITAHCYSLAQHFFWPDGKTTRLANLRGEAGTQWDYIVLCSDPYIMANFPGMYAEGVKLIQSAVAQSNNPAQVILLAQWPENSSTFSTDNFNEVVHRVGGSAGLTVVPVGKVWDSYTSQDTDAAHPTPKGAYLAAASIYSKLYDRSASTSGYEYSPGGDVIADHALTEVQAIAAEPQYSGTYTAINPFQMKHVSKRVVNYRETGTSTEDRLADALSRLDDVCGITFVQNQGSFWDFNYGRGNDGWEPEKQYEVDPAKYDRSYGFPMHHYYTNDAPYTMPYGIDKYFYGTSYVDGTDLGIAYNMIRPNTRELGLPEDVRAIPIRLMWLKMEQASPGFNPLGDNNHMHPNLNDASAAFMYTLLSGRCPVVEEPATQGSAAWMQWLGHKIGYETAWQMSHSTTRAPGFRVVPSTATRTSVTTTTPETMSVRFLNPPTSDVTVTVSISDPGVATVSPSTLTFTPANYNTPQTVTVTGKEIIPASLPFNVVFSTSSNDLSYHWLSDSWAYDTLRDASTVDLIAGFDGNNTSTTAGSTKTLSNAHRGPDAISAGVTATLWTTDTMAKEFQWTAANQNSLGKWGTLTLIPTPVTLNTTNVATISAPTTLQFTINNSAGTQSLDLQTLHFSAMRDTGATLQMTITYASGNLAGGSGVQSLVNDTGTNHGYDFDLTAILTDHVLAPGETATFTLAQTTVETGRLRLDDIAISGEVIPSGPDGTAPTPNPMTWASEPNAVNSSSITMTATTASDPSGVEYYFDETSGNPGGRDSGWQDSPAYTDTGLQADTQYTYTVIARDKAATPNATAASSAVSVNTSPASSLVDGSTSTVVASPTAVAADGTTTSTITVTLKTTGGSPVSGKTVSLVGNGSATIQTSNNISNASGVVTFTVKSSTVGTEAFTATGDSVAIPQTASVQFTAVVTPGVAILLGGFDGNQTQTAVGSTSQTLTTGVRQLTGGKQDAGAVGKVTTRIWTDQTTDKELQWNVANVTTTTGDWGLTNFATDASTASGAWVATQQAASWINFEISNTGTADVTLDKFHISAKRFNITTAPSPDTLTISLVDNGTFANPPVLSASPLTATGARTITLANNTNRAGYEFAFSSMLSDLTLAPNEKATFRIANNAGSNRLYLDNIAISGSLGGGTTPNQNFFSWISGFNVGGQSAFSDDPDKDGLANGIENYFGTHPGEFSAGLIPDTVDTGAGTFTFTHPVNENPASDVSAAYRWSKDLSNFHYSGESDPAETTVTFTPGAPSGGRVTVTASITGTSKDRVFVDIEVTQD